MKVDPIETLRQQQRALASLEWVAAGLAKCNEQLSKELITTPKTEPLTGRLGYYVQAADIILRRVAELEATETKDELATKSGCNDSGELTPIEQGAGACRLAHCVGQNVIQWAVTPKMESATGRLGFYVQL